MQQPLTFVGWTKNFTHPTIYDGEFLPTLQYNTKPGSGEAFRRGEWPFAPTECFALKIFSAIIYLPECFAHTNHCSLLI